MKHPSPFGLLALSLFLALAGCKEGATDKTDRSTASSTGHSMSGKADAAEVKGNLAMLSPEDRRLAEAQKLCPISGEPLGSMGVPPKLTLEDQPVFLCCAHCEKKALANPAQTLAKVIELKEKNAAPK